MAWGRLDPAYRRLLAGDVPEEDLDKPFHPAQALEVEDALSGLAACDSDPDIGSGGFMGGVVHSTRQPAAPDAHDAMVRQDVGDSER